jgi:hypothetical protein
MSEISWFLLRLRVAVELALSIAGGGLAELHKSNIERHLSVDCQAQAATEGRHRFDNPGVLE